MWYESVQNLTCVGVGLAVAVLFLLQKVISQSDRILTLESELETQRVVRNDIERDLRADLGLMHGQRNVLERWLKDEMEGESSWKNEVYFLRRLLNSTELDAHVAWENGQDD